VKNDHTSVSLIEFVGERGIRKRKEAEKRRRLSYLFFLSRFLGKRKRRE